MRTAREIWQDMDSDARSAARSRRETAPGRLRELAGGFRAAGNEENPSVRAPCCNREAALDGLLDIEPILAANRIDFLSRAGVRNPEATFLCGSCRGRLFRSGVIARAALARALGANAATVARFAARDAGRRPA